MKEFKIDYTKLSEEEKKIAEGIDVSPEKHDDFIIEQCLKIRKDRVDKSLLFSFYLAKVKLNSNEYMDKRDAIQEAKIKDDMVLYDKLVKEYNSLPLVKEYEALKEEVSSSLGEIKTLFEERMKA